MQKRLISIIAAFVLICGIGSAIVLKLESDRCPLCEFIKSHAPCLVNIETGEVEELALYAPHDTLVGELAEVQIDSTFSFVSVAGAKGIRISSPYKMELEIPITYAPVFRTAFCKECRDRLSRYSHGYVLADLYDYGNPVLYEIQDGLEVSIRCYDISVSYNKEDGVFDFFMIGTYRG